MMEKSVFLRTMGWLMSEWETLARPRELVGELEARLRGAGVREDSYPRQAF